MIAADRIEAARAVPIEETAERYGLKLRGRIERVGPCPRCAGHDRFAINTRKQCFLCRGCGARGDTIALAQFIEGCDFAAAVGTLAGGESRPRAPRTTVVAGSEAASKPATDDAWKRIWRDAVDPRGTLVETYLRSRGLELPDGVAAIRFHDALWFDGNMVAGMVALFRDIISNQACGIHRTFLDRDGRKLNRRMLGRAGNAAIKLDDDQTVEQGLHIGEGVETCLAAMAAGYRPTWALGSAGAIAKFPLLNGIEAISTLAERNDGGASERATEELRQRWADREVFVIEPLIGDDANDAWRGGHHA